MPRCKFITHNIMNKKNKNPNNNNSNNNNKNKINNNNNKYISDITDLILTRLEMTTKTTKTKIFTFILSRLCSF